MENHRNESMADELHQNRTAEELNEAWENASTIFKTECRVTIIKEDCKSCNMFKSITVPVNGSRMAGRR